MAANFYFGSCLQEVHLRHPWHQYYDIASWEGQSELAELLCSLGVGLRLRAPTSVLPCNLVQKMLAFRYPELYAYQWSVKSEALTEKNLHVSLLKLYHDIPITSHCSDELFRRLVRDFVAQKLSGRLDFGFNDFREIAHLEMMAIIWRRRDHRMLDEVGTQIPRGWDASWIDFLHTYVNPDLDPSILEIFREHADEYDPAAGEYRIATPGPRQGAEGAASVPASA